MPAYYNTNKPAKILVIPDSHATPGHDNDRYKWLSKLTKDIKPDVVIDIGDWYDMPSLCHYDKGTKGFQGRRYKEDVAVGVEAQDLYYTPLKKRKKKMPLMLRCLGNHEHRINRAIDKEPEMLEGVIGISDLQSKEYGWDEYGFLEPVKINGVNFCHYFASGVMGRPASSARTLLNHQNASCIQGHAHTFDYATKSNVNGKTFHGIFCGVFQDYDPPFAAAQAYLWRRGCMVLHDVMDGDFDMEWISMDRLRRAYAK
jgi:hypothetical protein